MRGSLTLKQKGYEDLRNEDRGRIAEANHEQNMLQNCAHLVVCVFQPREPPHGEKAHAFSEKQQALFV
jgi:hypothetical protein